MRWQDALRRGLPGLWAGLLAAIAFVAMPAAFAVLDREAAGRLARAVFEREAQLSVVLGIVLAMLERRAADDAVLQPEPASDDDDPGPPRRGDPFTAGVLLPLGAIFCTVAGFYGLQPMMEQARAGMPTALGFGQLHALSLAFFGAKGLMVLGLARRALR